MGRGEACVLKSLISKEPNSSNKDRATSLTVELLSRKLSTRASYGYREANTWEQIPGVSNRKQYTLNSIGECLWVRRLSRTECNLFTPDVVNRKYYLTEITESVLLLPFDAIPRRSRWCVRDTRAALFKEIVKILAALPWISKRILQSVEEKTCLKIIRTWETRAAGGAALVRRTKFRRDSNYHIHEPCR